MSAHEPLPVLFTTQAAIIGGAERSLLYLLETLDRSRVAPHVTCASRGDYFQVLMEQGYAPEVAPMFPMGHPDPIRVGRNLAAAVALARQARRVHARAIYSNSKVTHWWAGLAGQLAGVPVVWHIREVFNPGHQRVYNLLARPLATHVVTISDAIARQFAPTLQSKLTRIWNGVPVEEWQRAAATVDRAAMRRSLGLPDDALVIGAISRLDPIKRLDFFLDALPEALAALPQARVVIVGGDDPQAPDHAARLRERAARPDLAERVTFTGHRQDMPALAAAMDVVAMTSNAEGLGRIILEAGAVGVPCVAANAGGMPEIVRDGVTGLLFPPDDPPALAAALIRVLAEPGLRDRLGAAARRHVSDNFTIEATTRRVTDVIEHVVDPRGEQIWQTSY